MRMEQYLTFTNHALWEVIVNGYSVLSVASASAEGPIPPKTAEQKLARKNKLKAKSTLILAIPDEHLLKFYACKDANPYEKQSRTGLEAIRNQRRCRRPFSSRIIKTLLHQVKKDWIKPMIADDVMFSFFSNQSNAPQLDNKDFKHIDTDDLEETNLNWQVAMLTMRVKRLINKTGRKPDLNGKESVGFCKTKVECYNCYKRGHFARECRAPKNQGNRNRDTPTRNAPVDTSTTNALVHQVQTLRAATSVSAARHVNIAASRPNVKNLLDQQQFFQLLIQKIKAKALCKRLKSLQRTQERLRFRWMKSWL
nr:hypothetical protein [Tanacetum cinerariifolium]